MVLVPFLGFDIPLEWIIGVGLTFIVMILIIVFLLFSRPSGIPTDRRMLLKVPIDEAGIIQRGKILQRIQRTARDLLIQDPDEVDDEGNEYIEEASIENKVPFPAQDADKANTEIWIGRVQNGITEIVSASQLMGNIPVRYDPPPADAKKLFRPLMPWGIHGTVEEMVTNKNFWAIMIPSIIASLAIGHII